MSAFFLAQDAHNSLTLWQANAARQAWPRAIIRQRDVEPEAWRLVVKGAGLTLPVPGTPGPEAFNGECPRCRADCMWTSRVVPGEGVERTITEPHCGRCAA